VWPRGGLSNAAVDEAQAAAVRPAGA